MVATNTIFFTRHDGGLTLYIDNKPYTISSTAPQFPQLLIALKAKAWSSVKSLMSLGNTITELGKSKNRKLKNMAVFVKGGKVYFQDKDGKTEELNSSITERIIKIMGKPQAERYSDALLMFMHNALQNPYKDIREELYDFLKAGDQPITYDGCFLAYKRVKNNYKDLHSGTMDNSPGKIVRVDNFDTNRYNDCAAGSHFAAFGYLSSYASCDSNRTIIVKVNPAKVVAIPRDYSHQKGRASEYLVVGEFKEGALIEEAFKDSFIDEATKGVAAPSITFVKSGLRPSFEARAEAAGLLVKNDTLTKGGVYIVYDSKDRIVPVKYKGKKLVDLTGDEWILEKEFKDPELKSILTKTVREAVKKALDRAGL